MKQKSVFSVKTKYRRFHCLREKKVREENFVKYPAYVLSRSRFRTRICAVDFPFVSTVLVVVAGVLLSEDRNEKEDDSALELEFFTVEKGDMLLSVEGTDPVLLSLRVRWRKLAEEETSSSVVMDDKWCGLWWGASLGLSSLSDRGGVVLLLSIVLFQLLRLPLLSLLLLLLQLPVLP